MRKRLQMGINFAVGELRRTTTTELKERQSKIRLRIEQHQRGDGEYRLTLESLISLVSRAADLFECSNVCHSSSCCRPDCRIYSAIIDLLNINTAAATDAY